MATLDRFMHRLRACAVRDDGDSIPDGDLLECYLALRDETAFEALVYRHGPMVFGVCRRILRNDADAEDAFQATFLVLVRKANSIRPRGMVSNWLYGVAHNTALKAKAMIYKRRIKETEAGTMPKHAKTEEAWTKMQTVVDAELSLLPDKYRVPIVLCDLEGKTIKEAMHHLGWPQGTVASRLTRGRALLAKRLSKHGLQMSAGVLAGALTQGAASACVPTALTKATVQAAALYAAGKTAAATGASATAAVLTEGMLKTMLLVKLKLAAGALVLLAALTAGLGGVAYHVASHDPSTPNGARRYRVSVAVTNFRNSAPTESKDETAHGAQSPEPLPEPKTQPAPVPAAPNPLESKRVKVISIQTIVVRHGVDLKHLDPEFRMLLDLQELHQTLQKSAVGVLLVRRQSGPDDPRATVEIHPLTKDKGPFIIGIAPSDSGRPVYSVPGRWAPAGTTFTYTCWQQSDGKQCTRVVVSADEKSRHAPVKVLGWQAQAPAGRLQADKPRFVWVVIGTGPVRAFTPAAPAAIPPNPEPAGFLVGPLAP